MTDVDFQSALAALHFLRPHWLWVLLALPLLAWAWLARRQRQNAWRSAVDAHLLPHLLERGGDTRGNAAPWLALLALVLAIFALAGPSWRKGEQPLLQSQAPLVIALDLSSATLAGDLPPSRLLQARAKLATLLQQRKGGQVGLVAFADDAYTVAPLTEDSANVALFLDALEPGVMPADGSNAAHAIEQSQQLLKQAGFGRGDILVMTDHADGAARSAAAEARRAGYRVSALGLGTAAGAAYRAPSGAIAHARLDAGSLRALASAGGGRYAALTADTSDLQSLGVLDASILRDAVAANGGKATAWRDEGYWLLLPLMLLALLAFRRGGMSAAVLLCVLLPLSPARAAGEKPAADPPPAGTPWRRADQVQHMRMQQGEQAYRKQDFAAAEQAWRSLPGADAAYNRGNALAKAGRYDEAISEYDKALRLNPKMQDAIANRKAVEAAKKRQPPPGDQKRQQSNQPKPCKPGEKDCYGKSDNPNDEKRPVPDSSKTGASQSPGKQEKPGNKKPDTSQSSNEPDQSQAQQPSAKPPKPDDAEAQRKADAEQRARMQQALQRQQQGDHKREDVKQAAGEAQGHETAAKREQRQANEAWLRRVPDDPGGLLRAKFRLEYERRQQTGER